MSENDCITYQSSGYFSKLINDYLDKKPELDVLYNRFPSIENFGLQIEEKAKSFIPSYRKILFDALKEQYSKSEISQQTDANIQLLLDNKTFTITTGHQLNLFTGPVYFIYKIISTINLCKKLKTEFPENNFVPVYWMASEDHDFEEINHFYLRGKKINWIRDFSGAVGRLTTTGLSEVYDIFKNELGKSVNAEFLCDLFKKAYLEHHNLAEATRFLVNELFKEHGLVIIDGDDKELKKVFASYVEKELFENISYRKINETLPKLKDYTIQVNPREINIFYCKENIRERIVFEEDEFKIFNTSLTFSDDEIKKELKEFPENFSPNVVLRPLYQEIILPNLCYIGGGGEIAYWLELKSNFDEYQVAFPILLVRNSVLVTNKKQIQKKERLNLSWKDLFTEQQQLFNNKTKEFSTINFDFSKQKEFLKEQFDALKVIAAKTDISFEKAVIAQEVKQKKGLDNLEKKLLKAEKKLHHDKLERIIMLQNELFPNQSLQERKSNFSEFYVEFGEEFINVLFETLNPLESTFSIISL